MSHEAFLPLKPVIERQVAAVCRTLSPADLEDAQAEAVASAFESWLSLTARGKDPLQFPSTMATFAALQVKNGRHVGARSSRRDVISPTAQKRRGFPIQSLPLQEVQWGEIRIDDALPPVSDQVASRRDLPGFRRMLTSRNRKILDALANGDSGTAVANQLHDSWARNHLGTSCTIAARRPSRPPKLPAYAPASPLSRGSIPPWFALLGTTQGTNGRGCV